LSFFLFVVLFFCPSRYVARHRKPRRCVYVLNLGGTGIRPPDSFSYRSNFRFRFRSRSRYSSSSSGDIFYCSGSRQLNHSSLLSFYSRQHIRVCYSAYMPRQFRPSVCHTRVGPIVSKRLKVSSKFFHDLIGPSF